MAALTLCPFLSINPSRGKVGKARNKGFQVFIVHSPVQISS
uniref:Uncharacterized protein n=1 Tax=Anguilla anguilla TaxID=7936 RepID=A0A0E9WQB1_ANGAN